MYYMHTLDASKCMHVVHSVGFRSVLVLSIHILVHTENGGWSPKEVCEILARNISFISCVWLGVRFSGSSRVGARK